MKKIEKLEGSYDVPQLKQKLNEIIDYLNTQPQTEEKNDMVSYLYKNDKWERYASTEDLAKGIKEWEKEIESTPEQKKDWEFDLRNLMYRDGEQLRCAGEGKPYTGEYRELVVSMIKNLLSEREREVLNSMREWVVEYHKDNWDIRDFDAEIAIGKIIDRELSKLKSKQE